MTDVRVIGDRVQRHAFAGTPYRQGFCGEVIGTHGRTVRVRTEDGTEYDALPSELVTDGESWPGVRCVCCARSTS